MYFGTSILDQIPDGDVGRAHHVLHRLHLVTLHRRLQRADRVDFRHDHAAALAAQRFGAPLAHPTESEHDGNYAAEHDVGRTVQAVDDRVTAAVDVVELALGHRVVDVDRREHQRAFLLHLIPTMHAGGRLFADAADAPAMVVHLPVCLQEDRGPLSSTAEANTTKRSG
jgi:hypothetical protein